MWRKYSTLRTAVSPIAHRGFDFSAAYNTSSCKSCCCACGYCVSCDAYVQSWDHVAKQCCCARRWWLRSLPLFPGSAEPAELPGPCVLYPALLLRPTWLLFAPQPGSCWGCPQPIAYAAQVDWYCSDRAGVVLLAGITCLHFAVKVVLLRVAPAQFVCSVVTAWRRVPVICPTCCMSVCCLYPWLGPAVLSLLCMGDKVCAGVLCYGSACGFVCIAAGVDLSVWHRPLRVVGQFGEYCPQCCCQVCTAWLVSCWCVGCGRKQVRWWAWVSRRCCAMGSCHVNECRFATVVHPLTVIGRTEQCPRFTFLRSGCLVSSVECVWGLLSAHC